MKVHKFAFLSLASLFVSCGKSTDERKESQANALSSAEVMASPEAQSQILNESHEELTDQIADLSGSVSNFALAESKSISDKATETSRTCTEDTANNSLTVKVARSYSGTIGGAKVNKTISFSDDRTRVWSHPTIDLKCKEEHLDFSSIAGSELGLKKEVTYKKSRSMTATYLKQEKSRSMTKEGARTVEFTANIGAADARGFKMQSQLINGKSAKSIKITAKGEEKTITTTSTISDLKVDVNKNDSSWDYKIINSGAISSAVEGGVKLEIEYTKVKFVNSEEVDLCRPVSGSIKGSIKSTEESKDFTIDFSESSDPVVKVNGEVSTDLDLDFSGCEFGKAN
jgi:hypothetical protein